MGKITLILGGARSGKSTYALKLAKKSVRVAFIATCEPKDKEMRLRVALHKKTRPASWKTFQAPQDLASLLIKIGSSYETVIVDCLTLLVSGYLLKKMTQEKIENEMHNVLKTLKNIKAHSILVSNEVGLGIVPVAKMGREFRDIAGRVNQMAALESDKVVFMLSGLPLELKKGTR
ncbi:MAG: bifunctional adenosylcobinamide kinase/adenosylcobinamide-phosphate guanylyltransferase [Candidatus Omnitrophica bacterium]|nr:bifunctional adenosylcobinamide kinase/adenosylcobinamide-phosphate guanylyltransferase [Candidatus Omnitrophota bacterium]